MGVPSSPQWSGFERTLSRRHWLQLAAATVPLLALGAPTAAAAAEAGADQGGQRRRSRQQWLATGNMAAPRSHHTATRLADGTVLVAGGTTVRNIGTATAEVYDPRSGAWGPTADMTTNRTYHTATLLPNGTVLVVGGLVGYGGEGVSAESSAEIYDPATGTWSTTASLVTPRFVHSATALPDGTVLVAGGRTGKERAPVSSAELYHPETGTWTQLPDMAVPHSDHTATLLHSGSVLVAGGGGTQEAPLARATEIFDPRSGSWSPGGDLVVGRRFSHTATLLRNEGVLVAGGQSNVDASELRDAEIFDPEDRVWGRTGALSTTRRWHTATLLRDHTVLTVGGFQAMSNTALASAERYYPRAGSWLSAGAMGIPRYDHSATLLENGAVLVAGGRTAPGVWPDDGAPTATAELFVPTCRYR